MSGDRFLPATAMSAKLYLDNAERLAYCDEAVVGHPRGARGT
jgi:hypothetical protein